VDLKSCRVLVTPTSYGRSDPRVRTELEAAVGEVIYNAFGRPLKSHEVRHLLPGCDGYIAGLDEIDANALEGADKLRVIARYGVGVDGVDLAAAAARSIVVTNTPLANALSVAELTIGLILSLARSIPELIGETRAGRWPRNTGVTLSGKTVGLIGLGAIGKYVATRLRAFDCTVLAYDPAADTAFAAEHGVELAPLEEVVRRADFLSLHLPLLPTTIGMVDAAFLAEMKRGSFLINTARGELIEEAALLAALESGHLSGAALDAFSQEPPRADDPLLKLPQLLVTPHAGAHTDGAVDSMGWGALHDCLAVLRGEPPQFPVPLPEVNQPGKT
jgi:phosphoglycerate dehydrogenase-like enzyme